MPDGIDLTNPLPATATLSSGSDANVATATVAGAAGTVHVSANPLHAPLQPANLEPMSGIALSVTIVPAR